MKVKTTEHAEQCFVREWRDWMKAQLPALRWLFAAANGGARHPVVASKLKAEGVVRGVSDLLWLYASRGYAGLALEMKKPDGRLEPEQKEFLTFVAEQGYFAVCAYSGETAVELIKWYCRMRKDLPDGKYKVFSGHQPLCPTTESNENEERV